MALNPVVIAGSLSKEELEKSIQEIVKAVDSGMDDVSTKFDTKLAAIEENFKKAGTKIGTAFKDSFNAALGGSFDQLAAAMEKMSKASAKGTNAANAANASSAVGGAKNKNITYPEDSIGELRQQIKELQTKLNYEKKSTSELQKQVDLLHQAKAELKTQTTIRTFDSVFGMKEDSLSQISAKMRAYKSVTAKTADEQKRIRDEYQRLSQRQKELLGTTKSLANGNSVLARSFGYIRNRLMYALTIGAVMNFVKQMYSVRAEYELLERSMGVLIDNFRRGSEIFNELNAMALKSPFTLVELGTAAKQLLAYNFAEDEVVDTTRRLADISAALGVPMERLVYNLGQIRAQTVLTARDARDFANAGLAIVPMLAKMYTEQKKFGDEIVTTAQVYDMMKKKLVTYEDVMKVINQVTDEGGKFFDFQAKQAETLKVQLANLTLAWNNMLNDIASSNQTSLNAPIKLVKQLFTNWREVAAAIKSVIAVLGAYKTMQFLQSDALIRGLRLARIGWYQYTKEIKLASGAMATFNAITKSNVLLALAGVLASVASYFIFFKNNVTDANGEIERFGASGEKVLRDVRNLYAILEVTNKSSSNYAKVMGELNQILEEYGLQTIKETDDLKELNESREKNIELLKREALEREHLNNISSVNEKYQTGYDEERKRIEEYISKKPVIGKGRLSDNATKYAFAISNIISSTVEENLTDVLNKSGVEYFKGVQVILEKVKASLLASNDILGLSEQDIHLLTMSAYGVTRDAIDNLKQLKEAQDGNTESLNRVYNKNKQLIDQNTTFNEKVDQSRRKLESASNDTEKFYGKLNKIVKDYSGKNIIEFLVDVNAQVPEWMKKMGVEQVTKLASQFGALTENAVRQGKEFVTLSSGEKLTTKYLAMRTAQYTQARKDLEKVVEEPTKSSGAKKDPLGDALTKELQLITDIQKLYKEYTKAGIDSETAKNAAAKEYQKTLEQTNNTLSKFGVQGLTGEKLATMDLRAMRDYYQSILDKVQSSPKAVEALEKAIRNLNVEITKEGQKTIIDSLNSELSKLKDEYELAVDLDANPELGGAFAEAFDISTSDLPHTIEEVINRAQNAINNALLDNSYSKFFDILKGDTESLRESMGQSVDSKFIDAIEKAQKAVRDLWKKDAQETISGWNKLLEKYAEYEYKRTQIINEAEKAREAAIKNNAGSNVLSAIDIRKRRDLAALNFDEFQHTPEWLTAIGDVSTLTDKALRELISDIETYKASARDLDPKKARELERILTKLRGKLSGNNVFTAIKNEADKAKDIYANFTNEIQILEEEYSKLQSKVSQSEGGVSLTEEELKRYEELPKLIEQAKKKREEFRKIRPYLIVGEVSNEIKKIGDLVKSIGNLSEALGADESTVDTINAIGEAISGIGEAIEGISKLREDFIGGLTGIINGISRVFRSISERQNKKITQAIEVSKLRVMELENAYKNLEKSVDKAFGAAKIGAREATVSSKQAQLAQLELQLALEQSRKKKYMDYNAIISLKGQIIDLKQEIEDMKDTIVNDFLGISDVGSAVDNMVSVVIDALRNGENAMESFNGSINDMIADMVKQVISAKVVGPMFESVWNGIEKMIKERYRNESFESMLEQYEKIVANFPSAEVFYRNVYGMDEQRINELRKLGYNNFVDYDAWRKQMEELKQTYYNSTIPSLGDIQLFADKLRELSPMFEPYISGLNDIIDNLGLKTDKTTDNLSNLQQGIQSITEDTAGALEAYMNGVSQQVYLHSDLLTQIRDVVVGFDLDVQLGVQSQMLLQLQNNYIVMQSMQSLMENWTTPAGNGIRVEVL